jgi:hypothetical protein
MSKLDPYELEVLEAYEQGKLGSVASKLELAGASGLPGAES